MPLIQMSASYVDKEWPSVKIWASYVYITRSLWVLKKKSESPYTYIFTPGVILLNKKPNITIDIFKTFCVLIEVGKAREEVSYVMGEVPQWLVPNCNTYFFIFFILYIIIESTGCSEYTGSQCVLHILATLFYFSFFLIAWRPICSSSLRSSPYSFDAMRKFDLVAMNRSLPSVISNKNVWHLGRISFGQSTFQ